MDSLNTKRVVYSLTYLLEILTDAGEISEAQARIIMAEGLEAFRIRARTNDY